MSYVKELEEFILRLKGGSFFLSPREKVFLEFLEEMGVPPSVVKEAIESCLSALEPRKREKFPVFLCLGKVMEFYENYLKISVRREPFDWRERFKKKIEQLKHYLEEDPPQPGSEEEAAQILKKIEGRIIKRLWESLDASKKREILRSARSFRKEDEIYKEIIKKRIREMFGLPDFSLYVG
jgi:hypothetical protein